MGPREKLAAAILAAGVISSACAPMDQQSPEPVQATLSYNLLWYLYNESGNCLHSWRSSAELGRLSCSRTPRSGCDLFNYRDVAGTGFIRQNVADRYSSDWAALRDQAPDCTASIAAAAALTTFRADSTSNETSISNQNVYAVADDCAATANSARDKLISNQERLFYFSARGFAAAQARLLGQSACFEQITYSPSERSLIDDIQSGARLLETECYYGANAAIAFPAKLCNSTEKSLAHPFDFALPLP